MFDLNENPSHIIDAGANIGLTSIYFANRYPAAKIFSLEPEETNFELLKVNTARYENIVPIKTALWKENTSLALIPGDDHRGFQTLDQKSINAVNIRETVTATTVENIMKEYNIENIDLLKINIVGSEKEVFEDASLWIDCTSAIIIDLNDWLRIGCRDNFRNATKDFDVNHHFGDNIYIAKKNPAFSTVT
jgi:FkbM family methyltransferase